MNLHSPSPNGIEARTEQVRAWLDANGPATRSRMMREMGWNEDQIKRVLNRYPAWLVAVGVTKSLGYGNTGMQTLYHSQGEHTFGVCERCERKIFHPSFRRQSQCQQCAVKFPTNPRRGVDFFTEEDLAGIDPSEPCPHQPGSEGKSKWISARHRAGLPLWNPRDVLDLEDVPEPTSDCEEFQDEDWD